MTVLQVCAYAARYGGNFIASIKALDADLLEQGIETIYLFPEQAKNMVWCKELIKKRKVFFASTNRFSIQTLFQVKTAMQDADVVHSHFELYDCLCALAKRKEQKLFWHLHDSFDENTDVAHEFMNRIQYGIIGKRAKLISPNQYYADYTVNLGFPRANVYLVDNCIDCNRLTKETTAREKKYDFLVFGGFYKIKGLDILLDAARILVSQRYQFTIGVVGYPETWEYIDNNYPDVKPCIIREEPREDVSYFYNSARVFVSSSRRESFSYALQESLYLGLPVISSDIVGTMWAQEYSTTMPFKSEDSVDLAKRMAMWLNGERWSKPNDSTTVAQIIKKKYDIARWVNQIKEIYLGV